MLPLLGSFAEAGWVHWLFVAIAAPVTVMALSRPYTPRALQALAGAGMAGLVAGAIPFPSPTWSTPITVLSGTILALAHVLNTMSLRHRRLSIATEKAGA